MRLRRGLDDARSERGLTLVELCVTVIIMALVIGPLSMTLIQALNLVPQSGARTRDATDDQQNLQLLGDDLAQTQNLTFYNTGNVFSGLSVQTASGTIAPWTLFPLVVPGAILCTAPGAPIVVGTVGLPVDGLLAIGSWIDPATGTQQNYLWYELATAISGTTFFSVTLHRYGWTGSTLGSFWANATDSGALHTGYCNTGSPMGQVNSVVNDQQQANVQVKLTLRDAPNTKSPIVTSIYNVTLRPHD